MADVYYSMTDAEKLTGTHRETIRRLVDRIKKKPDHPDRKHVRPTPEEYEQKLKTKERFSWTVSAELLEREYAPFTGQGSQDDESKASGSVDQELLEAKDETINVLKQQVEAQQTQLARLNDRLFEAHSLALQSQEKYQQIPERVREAAEKGKQRWWNKHVYLRDLWRRRNASDSNVSRATPSDAAASRASVVGNDEANA